MRRAALHFAMLAMFPATLNTSPAAAAGTLAVPVCTGDGAVRTVNVPVGGSQLPGQEAPGCCVKGCHAGGSRKRGQR